MLSESSTSLTVFENSLATLIGIAEPVDTSYSSSALTVTVTALPSDGTRVLGLPCPTRPALPSMPQRPWRSDRPLCRCGQVGPD